MKRFIANLYLLFLLGLSWQVGASGLFVNINQATPLNTMQSMIDAVRHCGQGKRNRCKQLTTLCHTENSDGDVYQLCGMMYASDEDKKLVKDFVYSISLGAEIVNGDYALVHFTFVSEERGRRLHEYMTLYREGGKWYLSSF